MAESSAHKLSYTVETDRGYVPFAPLFRPLPDTRTTLALTKDNLETERLTGTRFPAEPRTGASGVSGEIPADLSFKAYDDFILSALMGTVTAGPGNGTDLVDLSITGTPTPGAQVGDLFSTSNGAVEVVSIDSKAENVTLAYLETGEDPDIRELNGLESATFDGENFQVTAYVDVEQHSIMKAGDTRLSFSILREFSDLGGGKPFLLYAGCEVSSWNLSASANGIAKSNFTFFGRDMSGPDAEPPTDSAFLPVIDTVPFDTFSGSMELDTGSGWEQKCIVTDYSLTINNGHAPRYTVGCATSQDPSIGQSIVEGSITAYFEDSTLYSKFVDEENFGLRLTLTDPDGNQMVITLPNLKIGSGTQPDVTADGPITIPVNFTAHYDDTLETHVMVETISPIAV